MATRRDDAFGTAEPGLEVLAARGLAHRFDLVTMERHGSWQAIESPPGRGVGGPFGRRHDEAARLVRAAFAGHPGVNFPPAGQGRFHALARSLPVRLLLNSARLAGWVSVRAEPDGSAMVESLVRHTGDRGRGLGAVLLTETLRRLEAAGLAPVRLDFAAPNDGALALYTGFGFRVTDTVPVHGWRLPPSAVVTS